MVKVELKKVIEFNTFLKGIENNKLPISLAYKIFSIYEAIEPQVKFYYERLQLLIQNYGELDENGNYKTSEDGSQILLIPEKISQCEKELKELGDCMVELNIPLLNLEELSQIKDLNISLTEMSIIKPFIEK